MSKNTHYIYYFNLKIEKYALNLFEPNQYVVARLAAPAGKILGSQNKSWIC